MIWGSIPDNYSTKDPFGFAYLCCLSQNHALLQRERREKHIRNPKELFQQLYADLRISILNLAIFKALKPEKRLALRK